VKSPAVNLCDRSRWPGLKSMCEIIIDISPGHNAVLNSRAPAARGRFCNKSGADQEPEQKQDGFFFFVACCSITNFENHEDIQKCAIGAQPRNGPTGETREITEGRREKEEFRKSEVGGFSGRARAWRIFMELLKSEREREWLSLPQSLNWLNA